MAVISDPVHDLVHDHAALNRQVLEIGTQLRSLGETDSSSILVDALVALRDQLFLHFAREEEGVFPFVTEALPQLADSVHGMETAHDTICGGLARMVHLAKTAAPVGSLAPLFDRFEAAYANHARSESSLLETLESRIDVAGRQRLAALVEGL